SHFASSLTNFQPIAMPQLIGASVRVVDTGSLTIDELAGNVATKNDRISIALVKITEPTSEPWLTLHYDEWMCVACRSVDMGLLKLGIMHSLLGMQQRSFLIYLG
ncbi:unnamed protein product, partial [Effrenium voratum]